MIDNKTIKNTAILASLVFACKNMVNCMPTVYDDGVINITVDEGCDKQMHKSRSHQKQCGYHNVHKGIKKHQIPHKQYCSVNDRMKDILKHKMTEEDFKVLFDNCVFLDEIDIHVNIENVIMEFNQLVRMLKCIHGKRITNMESRYVGQIVIRNVTATENQEMQTLLCNLRNNSTDAQGFALASLDLITHKQFEIPPTIYLITVEEALFNAIRDDSKSVSYTHLTLPTNSRV